MSDYYEAKDTDRILLVAPYSPEDAQKMKSAGCVDAQTRQAFVQKTQAEGDGLEGYYNFVAQTAQSHDLFIGQTESGHLCLIGEKANVDAADAEISARYNSRVFTLEAYADFEEQVLQARTRQGDDFVGEYRTYH